MTNLAVYLNDHLAGAAAALESLDVLSKHPDAPELNAFAIELRTAIAEDRDTLQAMMRSANISPSAGRQAAGWIGEKMAEMKVWIDDPADGALRAFELLELVALGIDGKRGLWITLNTAMLPELRGADYARLLQRAESQREAIEKHRLQWGRKVLAANVSNR
jgi:hypothetical protein